MLHAVLILALSGSSFALAKKNPVVNVPTVEEAKHLSQTEKEKWLADFIHVHYPKSQVTAEDLKNTFFDENSKSLKFRFETPSAKHTYIRSAMGTLYSINGEFAVKGHKGSVSVDGYKPDAVDHTGRTGADVFKTTDAFDMGVSDTDFLKKLE